MTRRDDLLALVTSGLLHGALGITVLLTWSQPLPLPPGVPVELVDVEPASHRPEPAPATPAVAEPIRQPARLASVAHRMPGAIPRPHESQPVITVRDAPAPATQVEPSPAIEPPAPPVTASPAPATISSTPTAASASVTSSQAPATSSGATAVDSQPASTAPAVRVAPPTSPAATGPAVASLPSAQAVTITQAPRVRGGSQVRPPYPPEARRARAEGTTLLRVHVTPEGAIAEVQLQRSAGHAALDAAAIAAVRTWRFEPARSGSAAVAGSVVVPFSFRIDGDF